MASTTSKELELLVSSLLKRANDELAKGETANLDVVNSLTDRVLKFQAIKAKGGGMGEMFDGDET